MKNNKGSRGGLQAFMNSPKGKTLLNYLYSWGAAIVILGTLFKLTHISGANLMLFVGMGTEVIVFIFSAFERPYDIEEENGEVAVTKGVTTAGGQPIIINGPIVAGGNTANSVDASTVLTNTTTLPDNATAAVGDVTEKTVPVVGSYASTPVTAPVVPTGNIDEMGKATEEYVEQIRALNEAIQRISQQAEALGKNMEEMETLSRNLTGVNAIYEIQLRSAGGQLTAVDQVNEQTQKMAKQIEELNGLYARMIEAMTSNMNRPQI